MLHARKWEEKRAINIALTLSNQTKSHQALS
jgi:hypothetical protein